MPDIIPSKKYIHAYKELCRERENGNITEAEYSQRVDELRKKEIPLHKSLGPVLIMQELEKIEDEARSDVEQEIQRKKRELEAEERSKLAELNRQLLKKRQEEQAEERKRFQEQIKKENDRTAYRNEIDNYIDRLEGNAQKWQKWYTWLQIVLLIFSAATATMASMDVIPRWIVSITGFIATIAGGGLTTFKIQDRIYASRKAVAEIQLERQRYDYHLDDYKDTDDEGAFIKFSRIINSIQGQQMLQEVELWNPRKEEAKEEKAVQDKKEEDQKDKEPDEALEKPPQQGKLLEKPSEEEE